MKIQWWWAPYHSTDSSYQALVLDAENQGHRVVAFLLRFYGWLCCLLPWEYDVWLRIVTWKTRRGRTLTIRNILFGRRALWRSKRQENYCKEYGERSCEDTEKLVLMEANDNHEEEHTVSWNQHPVPGNPTFRLENWGRHPLLFGKETWRVLFFVVVSNLFFKTVWLFWVVLLLYWTF